MKAAARNDRQMLTGLSPQGQSALHLVGGFKSTSGDRNRGRGSGTAEARAEYIFCALIAGKRQQER